MFPPELSTWAFWEEVLQWGLICYLLFRRDRPAYLVLPKEKPITDLGKVTVQKEYWENPL